MPFIAILACVSLIQGGEEAPFEVPVNPKFSMPISYGPLLADVTMRVRVAARRAGTVGVVTFPVPSDYSGQTVIGFEVKTEPAAALKSWNWVARPDGLNRVVNVNVAPGASEVTVSYVARVLAPGFEVTRTQKRDFLPWAGATTSIESDDAGIKALAAKLGQGAPERREFVKRVVLWVAKHDLSVVPGDGKSDASTALVARGEDSLAHANLCAAILRAGHIPARVVAHVPTWAERFEALAWLVEYESDEGDWDMVQPLAGLMYPVRNSVILLSTSSRRDESHGVGNPLALRPDAPTLSTPEISSELMWTPSNAGMRHTELHIIRNFPRASGARLMPGALRYSRKVTVAAKRGEGMWFDEARFSRIIAKGPINLALFLDGQPTMPDR